MADQYLQVAPDGSGKKIDTSELTVSANVVERQRVNLSDPTDAAGLVAVKASAVTGSEYGLVVRAIPSGTQVIQGVQDSATNASITNASSVVGPLAVTQRNVLTVTIRGTYAGVTFGIEASDDGTNYYPVQCINNATGLAGSTWGPLTNTVASFDTAIGGYTFVRVRATAWTSGTCYVGLTAQSFAYDPVVAAICNGVDVNAAPRILLLNPSGLQPITLGNNAGKTNVSKTGSLVTTAVTADQVILTYTVTAGKTLYLLGFNLAARLTTYAVTATLYGAVSLESPASTKLNTAMVAHAGVIYPPYNQQYSEPMPIAAGTVIRLVCTPAAATSMTWQGNFWGYEV